MSEVTFYDEVRVKVHTNQRPKQPELIPVSLVWSIPRSINYCYSPLDGMPVHHRVTPQQYVAGTHLYTGWRETMWSIVCCVRKQHNGRSLSSRPPDLEFEVLTSWPHKPPSWWYCLWRQAMLPTILLRTTLLYLTMEPVCTAQASCQ